MHQAPDDLASLRKVSARIGSNPLLIQGAGGNTSVKSDDGDTLWIKASGTMLADAGSKNIFVPVTCSGISRALAKQQAAADMPIQFLLGDHGDLRPSIETVLHAVFTQKVVLHAHCVHTLAHAVRQDCAALLEKKLAGLNWVLVPYAKPGANLAAMVKQYLQEKTDIVVLQNHGVIVAADSVAAADRLLQQVHNRLALEPAKLHEPDLSALQQLAKGSDYRLPKDSMLHQLALEPHRVLQAVAGSLYPDHVAFCGIGAETLSQEEKPQQRMQHERDSGAPAPVFFIVPGWGVLVHNEASYTSLVLTRCLVDVLLRTPADASLEYLSLQQNLDLLNWDAEKYRQAISV